MKKCVSTFAVAVLTIFVVADLVPDLVQEFITNDPVHFFAENPGQLVWVALISSFGGLLLTLCLPRPRPLPQLGGTDRRHFPP